MPRVRVFSVQGFSSEGVQGAPHRASLPRTRAWVVRDREEADQTQAKRKSHGRRIRTWGINTMAALLSSESRSSLHSAGAKPTRQVQHSPRRATNY